MLTKKNIQIRILLLFILLILVNVIVDRFFLRLDFTADKRYTLSSATKNILKSLDAPVTVTAYFSKNLPPDVAKTRKDFKELLIEYSNYSHGKVVYEFLNPNEDEQSEMKAQQAGVSPVIVNVREKDQVKQQKAYLGAVIQMGEKKDVIPFMQPGAAMEFALSSSIKKISVQSKPKIALLGGHGEATMTSIPQAMQAVNVLNDFEPLTLNDSTPISSHYKTVVIIAPKDSFPPSHLNQLNNFLANGGNIFIALNAVQANLQQASGAELHTGLEDFLRGKGIEVEHDFVIDTKCGSVNVRQQQGPFAFNTAVNFPYFPVIGKFADHPAVKGLEGVILPFASSIKILHSDSSLKIIPIAMTSEKAGTEKAPTFFNVQRQWKQTDFPEKNIPVAVALQGKISGNANSKMIVISNGSFAVNGEGQGAQQIQPDNLNFLVNSVDWLSDETGLIELRTKGITSRPLKQLEDSTKTMIKYANFILPMLAVVIYGFVRGQMRRRKKMMWMVEQY